MHLLFYVLVEVVARMRRMRSILWVTLCLALSLVALTVWVAASYPDHLRVLPGQDHRLEVGIPYTFEVGVLPEGMSATVHRSSIQFHSSVLGKANVTLRLLGLIPVRTVVVEVVPLVHVIPGGQAIGVMMSTNGLAVSFTTPVVDLAGAEHYPARDAGLEPGDVVMRAAGQPVRSHTQLGLLIQRYGRLREPLPLEISRNGKRVETRVLPVPTRREGSEPRYIIGIHFEAPAAGVGTLTFIEPTTRKYGALGHMITSGQNRPAEARDGRIVKAMISSIRPGVRGQPGEKLGVFQDDRDFVGTVEKNTKFGIFGRFVSSLPTSPYYQEPVPVALASQVKPGPAEILTVLKGEDVERFQIEIVKVDKQSRPDGRGLVIRMTDPELLSASGGIVQGMSGSPILQNGRLVGAVTHVFVNDPLRGYGILAEWMLYEAGIKPSRLPVPTRVGLGERRIGAPPQNGGWHRKRMRATRKVLAALVEKLSDVPIQSWANSRESGWTSFGGEVAAASGTIGNSS